MKGFFQWLKALTVKYRELILYIIFGAGTTIVDYGVYTLCARAFNFHYSISTIIAWVAAVAFAFITNKLFVFESKSTDYKVILRELFAFVVARLASVGLSLIFMWVLVDNCNINDQIAKLLINVIVVIINYVFSKLFIFKKKQAD